VHAGEARFVSLAEFIRSRSLPPPGVVSAGAQVGESSVPAEPLSTPSVRPGPELEPRAAPAALSIVEPAGPESASAVRAARLFGAALADTFDELAADLVRALAADVLGRELQLTAIDVATIARRLIAERRSDEPLSLRVCPADAEFACELPLIADPGLGPGDAVLVCRNGEIDARLAVRLAHVIAAVTP
jgi:hypothetical protein